MQTRLGMKPGGRLVCIFISATLPRWLLPCGIGVGVDGSRQAALGGVSVIVLPCVRYAAQKQHDVFPFLFLALGGDLLILQSQNHTFHLFKVHTPNPKTAMDSSYLLNRHQLISLKKITRS